MRLRSDLACFRRDRCQRLASLVGRTTGSASDGLAHRFWIGAFDAIHRSTLNGNALHVAALREVVVNRVMLGRAVVPHDQRVRRPVMTKLIFGNLRLLE